MNRYLFSLLLVLPVIVASGRPADWTASWIMHPGAEPQGHAVVLFRKTFDLQQQPDSFIIHVSADNHYRLFINGKYLLRGPARGDAEHWFYETVDIAGHLQPGKNVLAAEVVNWGPGRAPSFISQQTSFLLQGDSASEELADTHAGSWKCFLNTAFYPQPEEGIADSYTHLQRLYTGNPPDSIRGDQYPWGWETPGYDDGHWTPAGFAGRAAGRNTVFAADAVPSGQKLLVPRQTPILKETPMPFNNVRSTIGLTEGNSYIDDMGSLVVPPNDYVIILIDQSHLTMGYPEMIVTAGKDAIIQVRYAESLTADHQSPKGNRNQIDGKYMEGIKDVFVSGGGKNRLFKPTSIRAFRYIQLDIETFDEPLVIDNYYHVECRAPLAKKASFARGDELTGWIMDSGWRTVSLCAQDLLLSDAYYGQEQHAGSARVHNLSLLALSGDDRLTRNALEQFNRARTPDGLIPSVWPHVHPSVHPSSSLNWIDQVYDYMLWNDDREFISGFENGIREVLQVFDKKIQRNGLLEPPGRQYAPDEPMHSQNGEARGVHDDDNTLLSLQYAYTLGHAAALFSWLGNRRLARIYSSRATRINRAVNRNCLNTEGYFTDSPESSRVSPITNIMAILAEAVKGSKALTLMEKLLEPADWHQQLDLFEHLYLFEAMNKAGLSNRFHSQLTEWQLMMDHGLTTFAEVPLEWDEENERSECNPWSSAPVHFLFRLVCGITPLEAGHKKIEINPVFGEYEYIEAVYPHHLGDVIINLIRDDMNLKGEITVPGEMEATLKWGNKSLKLEAGTQAIDL